MPKERQASDRAFYFIRFASCLDLFIFCVAVHLNFCVLFCFVLMLLRIDIMGIKSIKI